MNFHVNKRRYDRHGSVSTEGNIASYMRQLWKAAEYGKDMVEFFTICMPGQINLTAIHYLKSLIQMDKLKYVWLIRSKIKNCKKQVVTSCTDNWW